MTDIPVDTKLIDPNSPLLTDRARRNINRKRNEFSSNSRYRSEIQEMLEIRDEIARIKPQIEANMAAITETSAAVMARAYAANPHMNPQMIVAAVFAGADEATIYQMGQQVAQVQASFGLYSGDQFDEIENMYPWVAQFKDDLRRNKPGEPFRSSEANQMGLTQEPQPTTEYFRSASEARLHRAMQVPVVARDAEGVLGLQYDSKSLGGSQKITETEAARLRPPEVGALQRYYDFILRRQARKQTTLPPFVQTSAEISELTELATSQIPNVAMIQTVAFADTLLAPVRWALDKTTPDAISDPASDFLRQTSRWGFSGVQALTDMPENLFMAATADPAQAPLGFRNQIAQHGVLDGLGKGIENAFMATGFGQASRDLVTGRDVDTGSGFFMGGAAQEEADKLKMFTLGYYTDQDGRYLRTRSFGTGSAEFLSQLNVIDRDGFAYNAVSGLIDASYEIFLDPTNLVPFVGWGDEAVSGLKALNSKTATRVAEHLEESRRLDNKALTETNPQVADTLRAMADQEARLAFEEVGIDTRSLDRAAIKAKLAGTSDQEIAIRSLLIDESGIMRDGARRTVLMPELAKFLIKGRGRRLVQRLQDETSPENIKLLFRDRIQNTAAKQLADANTPEDVLRVLVEGISNPGKEFDNLISMVPHVGVFSMADKGLWIRRNMASYTRMGNLLPPGSIVDPTDGNPAVTNIRQILNVIPTNTSLGALKRYDQAKKTEILDQFISAFASGNRGEVKKAFTRLANELTEVFIGMGYDPLTARSLTRFVRNDERLGAVRWRELASGAPIDTSVLAFNDLLSSGVEIIDARRLQQVIRQSGRTRQAIRSFSNLSPDLKKLEEFRGDYLSLRAAGKNDEAEAVIDKIEKLHRKINAKTKDDPTAVLDQGFLSGAARKADEANDAWKTLTVARGAYVLRVVPEELGRVLLTGVFDSWVDWLVTALSSSEKASLAGKGRYLSDVANRRFTRKTQALQKLDIQYELLVEELDELQKLGKGNTPQAAALQKEIDALNVKFDAENEAWDANFKSYQEAMIGSDRTSATRAVTRNRAKVQISKEGTAFATRHNKSQIPQWIDGVIERIMKLSNDAGGGQDIARAWVGMDVGGKFTFELNGVTGTVKQHLARGEDFEVVMAHHYVYGGGKTRYRSFVEAKRVDGDNLDPTNVDQAIDWVNDMIGEIQYIAGSSPQSVMLPNMLPGPFSASDEDLMRAIATGKFKGKRLQKTEGAKLSQKNGKYVWNKEFRDHVELWGLNPNAPDQVMYSTRAMFGNEPTGVMQMLGNAMFGWAYGVSSDVLARSPSFRRLYWKQAAEFVRAASPEQAKIVVRNAEKAKLDKRLLEKVKTNARYATGETTWEDIDNFARAAALDKTKDLLFDASRRGATADALRLVVSFGDAWYEVLKTWTRANIQRKGTPVKTLMKGIEGGRDMSLFGEMAPATTWEFDPETGEYEQVTSQKRRGLFYKDPTSDQWMYNLPMSNQLVRLAMSGEGSISPGPGGELRSAVEGLNIFGTLSPGLGPLGSMVAQSIVPNTPGFDWLSDILYPIAKPLDSDEKAAADVGLSGLLPNYIKRAIIAAGERLPSTRVVTNMLYNYERDPAFMNLQTNIMKSLDSTGNYAWDATGRKQLQEDTRKASANVLGLMALASFVGPAAPNFRHLLQTRDPGTGEILGNVVGHQFAQELNDLRRLYIDLGEDPNQASADMVYYYGPEIELSVVPNTRSKFPGQELSKEWWDWYRTGDTREFVATYPEVAAFFGAVNAERDNEVAGEMRSAQLTSPKTLDELDEDGRRLRAYRRYNQFLKNNGLDGPEARRTDEQRIRIAEYRNELERYFRIPLDDKTSQNLRETQLGELQTLVDLYRDDSPENVDKRKLIERHMGSQTGQAVLIYMDMRAAVQEATVKFGGLTEDGWRTSWAAATYRDRLRETGVKLSQIDPGFARLYQFVLEREMLDVDEEQKDVIRVGRPGGVR